jgi:thiamine transport system ATP-binding protein
MEMIRITNGKYHSDDFKLDMDIAIASRQFTAVLGPSGAGKSTLLNVISGFENLKSGTIFLNGDDHTITHPAERPISFVFQDNNSFAHLTARDNVALGLRPSLKLSETEWQSIDAALDQVGIAYLKHRKPGDMSGGERQRIALARVLVRNKPILLLDEAFGALGPALRNDMLDLVKSIQQQKSLTVLMVTHQPEDAKRVADNVIFIVNGKVNAAQSIKSFLTDRDQAIQDYLVGDS